MIIGDYNAVPNPQLDKSKKVKSAKMPKTALNYLEQLFLVDTWRDRNKQA